MLFHLISITSIAVVILYWWTSQGMRQIALQACRKYCDNRDLQLLDESVGLRRIQAKRDEQGRLGLCWMFEFEFTATGYDRFKGRIMILSARVFDIDLEPYRT